jgi:hypothetical protein
MKTKIISLLAVLLASLRFAVVFASASDGMPDTPSMAVAGSDAGKYFKTDSGTVTLSDGTLTLADWAHVKTLRDFDQMTLEFDFTQKGGGLGNTHLQLSISAASNGGVTEQYLTYWFRDDGAIMRTVNFLPPGDASDQPAQQSINCPAGFLKNGHEYRARIKKIPDYVELYLKDLTVGAASFTIAATAPMFVNPEFSALINGMVPGKISFSYGRGKAAMDIRNIKVYDSNYE